MLQSRMRSAVLAVQTIVALVGLAVPTAATAQPTQQQSQIVSRIDEAVKALDNVPRLKKLSPQAKRQLVEFVVGNTLFVMAHELGHGLINEMNMPVLGREEDAADSFAIVTALNMGSRFSERVLIEAAKGLVLSSKRDKKQGNALEFYDEHGLDLQRAYNVVCFMFGPTRKNTRHSPSTPSFGGAASRVPLRVEKYGLVVGGDAEETPARRRSAGGRDQNRV